MKRICSVFFTFLLLAVPAGILSYIQAEEPEEISNGIPVVYINIDESQGTIEAMTESPDHSVYCYGTVSIEVPEGFHYSDFPDLKCESLHELSMSIRGRGNSTWATGYKKPFKIKLDKKADVLGLGKNKHWALVANSFDSSLLKDRITAWLGDEMGFAFTPRGVPVDVVMTGENFGTQYLGSYYLSENVRVGENRLEIEELEESDTNPDVITGGYLLQVGTQVREGSPDRFYTSRGALWATDTPSFDTDASLFAARDHEERDEETPGLLGDAYANEAQRQYIQKYMQDVEDILYTEGTGYRDVIDIESCAKYWLVNMFNMNTDGYATGSTYVYKYRDTAEGQSKLYWGPLWDWDYAWNYNLITTGIRPSHDWMKPMLYDRESGGFIEEVHKQWPVMKDAIERLIAEDGVIDRYYEETAASALADHRILLDEPDFDYREKVEKLKTWIADRLAWINENYEMIDRHVHKVSYIVNDETYAFDYVYDQERIYGDKEHPDLEGYTFIGWYGEDGVKIDAEKEVTGDIVLTGKYIPDSEVTHGEDIAFSKDSDIRRHNVHVFMYQIPYTVIPTDAIDQTVEWTSSDESFATVDSSGMITYTGPGTVTVTGTLKNGRSRQFTLTVTEDDPPVPVSIACEQETLMLEEGTQGTLMILTEPSPASVSEFTYEPENPSIASVGENGVVTALAAGRTKVRIRTVSYDPEGNEVVCEAESEVIVAEKAPAYLEMHRVYNPNSGEHHYTSDTVEKDTLVSLGWNYEGIGWKAPGKSETPVYRLYNKNGGEHHYTMDKVERDALINRYHWTDEGIGWYSDDAKGVTICREYNPNAFANNHNYTADTKEHDALINKYGWKDEGTAWFGLK